jgi:hypothetical protein
MKTLYGTEFLMRKHLNDLIAKKDAEKTDNSKSKHNANFTTNAVRFRNQKRQEVKTT